MVLKVANRGNMPPFIVMDVMKAASLRESKGGDVLHLEVGQPSTKAPSIQPDHWPSAQTQSARHLQAMFALG